MTDRKDYRVIIAGGRDFNDLSLLSLICDRLLIKVTRLYNVIILSGTARGADKLGEQYAQNSNFMIERYPADWETHGRKAGIIRNQQMADKADALIAFWDGNSKGTQNMIASARKKGLPVRVIRY